MVKGKKIDKGTNTERIGRGSKTRDIKKKTAGRPKDQPRSSYQESKTQGFNRTPDVYQIPDREAHEMHTKDDHSDL